jgi:hypothetical protein
MFFDLFIWHFTACQRFCLHFKIDFNIDIRCINRNMSEPSSNSIDVYACMEKMSRCRMVWGLTRFFSKEGNSVSTFLTYLLTNVWIMYEYQTVWWVLIDKSFQSFSRKTKSSTLDHYTFERLKRRKLRFKFMTSELWGRSPFILPITIQPLWVRW